MTGLGTRTFLGLSASSKKFQGELGGCHSQILGLCQKVSRTWRRRRPPSSRNVGSGGAAQQDAKAPRPAFPCLTSPRRTQGQTQVAAQVAQILSRCYLRLTPSPTMRLGQLPYMTEYDGVL